MADRALKADDKELRKILDRLITNAEFLYQFSSLYGHENDTFTRVREDAYIGIQHARSALGYPPGPRWENGFQARGK